MAYRLGLDVRGTFTDLLMFDDDNGSFWRHKTPSIPHDSSIGILTGSDAVCGAAGIAPSGIEFFLHCTTVETDAVLEGKSARVGLVTTEGYRQILQIARSSVPGGLAGWIVWLGPKPLTKLENTVEIKGRLDAQGNEARSIEADTRPQLEVLSKQGVEALTVSLINAYPNGAYELRVAELAGEILPGVPVSLNYVALPEMQEYERTLITVAGNGARASCRWMVRSMPQQQRRCGRRAATKFRYSITDPTLRHGPKIVWTEPDCLYHVSRNGSKP